MNNFTPRAQQVLALARKEADRFHHNYVGTEHILLGLIVHGDQPAVEWMRATLTVDLPGCDVIVPTPGVEIEL